MARIRSVKPEFWLDRKLARKLTRDQRMLYLGLWNQADEHARANADARVIKGQVFPFDDDLTPDVVEGMLQALGDAGVIVLYEVDDDPFLFIPTLHRHQRLEPHKVESKHPAPPEPDPDQRALPGLDAVMPSATPSVPDADRSAPGSDSSERRADSSAPSYGAGSMEHGTGGTRGTRIPDGYAPPRPIIDQMITETGYTVDQLRSITVQFVDYWVAAPGQRGVKRDWDATWRNWVRKEADRHPPRRGLVAVAGGQARPVKPAWEL